jgi:uncharacterized membrane protein
MDLTWFNFLLFVHLTCVAIWLGGGAAIQFFALRALASDDPGRTAAFAGDVEWVGFHVFMPASLLVLIAGTLMVVDSDFYGFGDDWILIALVLFAATFLFGLLFIGPESGRISKLIEAEGPTSPNVQARVRRILALSRADLVLLYLVLYDMVLKPDVGDGWFWVGVLVAAAFAALLVWRGLNAEVGSRSGYSSSSTSS